MITPDEERTPGSTSSSTRRPSAGRGWRPADGILLAGALPGLILAGHLSGGGNGTLGGLVLAISAAVLGLGLFLRESRPVARPYITMAIRVGIPIGVLMMLVALSALPGSGTLSAGSLSQTVAGRTLSLDPQATWLEFAKLAGLAATFVAAERVAVSARRLRLTVWILIWTGVAWTSSALVMSAISAGSTGVIRLSGAFVSPNVAGALIVITLLLLLGETRPRQNGQDRAAAGGLGRAAPAIVLLAGLALTASRASIVIGLLLAVWLWVWPRRDVLSRALADGSAWRIDRRIAIAMGLAVGLLSVGGLVARLSATGTAALGRWSIVEIYASAAIQAPLTGHGLGSVPALSRLLVTSENYAVFWNIRAAHNLLLQWWVEAGLIGLALWAGAMAMLGVRTWSGLGSEGRAAMAGPMAALAFLLVHGLVDYELQIYSVAMIAAYLAGLCAAGASQPEAYWSRLRRAASARRPKTGRPGSPNQEPAARF